MLHCALMNFKQELTNACTKKLDIHYDNCVGQNRNRFVILLCSLLVLNGIFSEVELNFLVAGHTKNECDRAISCIKKRLRRTDVRCPRKMTEHIIESSSSAQAILASSVM